MAFVLKNCKVALDGVDFSTVVREVSVETSAAEVSTTAMGAGGEQRLAGIRDDKFTLTVYSDFSASGFHATYNAKFVAAGTIAVEVIANTATISATNPRFSGYCVPLTYAPISGAVGDAAMMQIELPVSGTIATTTAGTFLTMP